MFAKNEKGQTAVIIAMALVVLLAFAALAVDAGNVYSERRALQNAADAAAMAAARQVVLECGSGAPNVYNVVNQSTNMVAANATQAAGQSFFLLENGGLSQEIQSLGYVPCICGQNRAVGVEVNVSKPVSSFLAQIVGQGTNNVTASAKAQFGSISNVGPGLYPLTRRNIPLAYGELFTLRLLDDADTMPGNFGWLTWNGENNVPNLAESLTPPGDSQVKYFNPGTPDNDWTPNYNDKVIAVDKWVQGAPGNKNSSQVRTLLDWFISTQTPMIIPLYKDVAEQGSHGNYQVASFAAYLLQSYDFTGNDKSATGKFIQWVTNGDWDPTATCQTEGGVYSIKLIP